jgi:hypothetical protein
LQMGHFMTGALGNSIVTSALSFERRRFCAISE